MRYGVPYKGSKNSIAEWIYSHFPKADNFYDLFAGGCAITQIALMRQEYKNYICNDIDGDGIKLFLNAIYVPHSVIYCDIPYFDVDGYGKTKGKSCFDFERFYSWCEKQTEPVFISEYWMPEDRFECIDEIEKTVTLQGGAGNKAIEKLFIPRHQHYDKWQGTLFEGILN